jgi:hypothetical protein
MYAEPTEQNRHKQHKQHNLVTYSSTSLHVLLGNTDDDTRLALNHVTFRYIANTALLDLVFGIRLHFIFTYYNYMKISTFKI